MKGLSCRVKLDIVEVGIVGLEEGAELSSELPEGHSRLQLGKAVVILV